MTGEFREPTPESLRALAGWSLSRRANASDEQVLALGKFREGCTELAECCPAPITIQTSGSVTKTAPQVTETRPSVAQFVVESSPDSLVLSRYGMVQPCNGMHHVFDIRTQKCKSCGMSYRDAHGKKPELM